MFRSCLLVLMLACMTSCIKSLDPSTTAPGNSDDTDTTAAITDVGIPNGDPVSQVIGASGGTIRSSDGRVEMIIPSGALSGDQNITIQPITNECPNGIGEAYDFLPNGLKFLTPATLILHYTDDDANGTDPFFMNMAFQDSLYHWMVDVDKDVDTVNKTVSFDLTHFSPRGPQTSVIIKPDKNSLVSNSGYDFYDNDEASLVVTSNFTKAQISDDPGSGRDELSTLTQASPVSKGKTSNWTVGGGSNNGTLSSTTDNPNTYKAPSKIDQARTIYVSVRLNQKTRSKDRRGHVSVSSGYEVYSVGLRLHPTDLNFTVHAVTEIFNTNGTVNDHYHDEVTFEIDVKDGIITVPNEKIDNHPPTETPDHGSDGSTRVTWIPDPYGEINMTGGGAQFTPDPVRTDVRDLEVLVHHANTKATSWMVYDLIRGVELPDITGNDSPGYPLYFTFVYKDSAQVIDPEKGNPLEGNFAITVTPVKPVH